MRDNTKIFLLFGLVSFFGFLTLTKTGREFARKIGATIMDISDTAIDVIRRFEGFSPIPYRDAQGFSIGYGHFILPGENLKTITEPQARELLKKDAAIAANAVRKFVKVPLNQNQFDALISFVYNVGVGGFRGSTMLKKLNTGDYSAASKEFARWNKSNNVVIAALDNRRAREAELFMSA